MIAGRKHKLPKSINKRETLTPPFPQSIQAKEINCDRTHYFYDICSINGPTVLDPTTSTFFLMDPIISTPQKPMVEKLRPYPRKWESFIMHRIKKWKSFLSLSFDEVRVFKHYPSQSCE